MKDRRELNLLTLKPGIMDQKFKDELPEHHNASLAAFLGGMVGYSALLVSVAH